MKKKPIGKALMAVGATTRPPRSHPRFTPLDMRRLREQSGRLEPRKYGLVKSGKPWRGPFNGVSVKPTPRPFNGIKGWETAPVDVEDTQEYTFLPAPGRPRYLGYLIVPQRRR